MEKEPLLTEQVREDVYAVKTDKTGLRGFIEIIIRKFRMVSYIFTLMILYFLILVAMGISVTPGVYLFMYAKESLSEWPQILHYFSIGFSIVCGYFLYGFFIYCTIMIKSF